MFILGKKLKMSQIWKDKNVISVTVIEALPNTVSTVRSKNRDGYDAVQLQYGKSKKEFRTTEASSLKQNDVVNVSVLSDGDLVSVRARVKGRGFQGVVKRHGFSGGPKTHGQKNRLRAPGSIGNTTPQRVIPGRKMAGHMGTNWVTVKNIKIVKVDAEKNMIFLNGAVPGARGGLVEIKKVRM